MGKHRSRTQIRIRSVRTRMRLDTMFANAVYMMLNTVAMAGFGLLFWLISAREHSARDIGVATTLISGSGLIALVSLLGFNGSLVRYLPLSKQKSAHIDTALMTVGALSAALAAIYFISLPFTAPGLASVARGTLFGVCFVLSTSAAAVNSVTDNVFIAYRRAEYNLLVDGAIQGVLKVVLAISLVSFGALGVFNAVGISSVIAVLVSVWLLVRKFEYWPRAKIHRSSVVELGKFTIGSYVAYLLNLLPVLLIPLIVINQLDSDKAAYYYLTFMLANVAYTAAYAISNSAFAELSSGTADVRSLLGKALRLEAVFILPASLVLLVAGPHLLTVFGGGYRAHASSLILILGLACPVVAAYDLFTVMLKATGQIRAYVITNFVYAASILGLVVVWVNDGLEGVGWAWLCGNTVSALLAAWLVMGRGRWQAQLASGDFAVSATGGADKADDHLSPFGPLVVAVSDRADGEQA